MRRPLQLDTDTDTAIIKVVGSDCLQACPLMGFNGRNRKLAAGQAQELMEEFMKQAHSQGHDSQMLSSVSYDCFCSFYGP